MSAATVNPVLPNPARPAVPRIRVTFPRVVVSEVRKMLSLRSTWWTLGIFVVMHAGLGALYGLILRSEAQSGVPDPADATSIAGWLGGFVLLSQLALVVIAVLTITTEYASGQIHGSLMAVPTRVPLLVAKAVVLTVVTFVVAVVACALALGLGRPIAGDGASFDLSTSETAWQLLAGPLYLVGIVLLSFSVGALLRHSAAAIASIMAMLTVIQFVLLGFSRFHVVKVISTWVPGIAGWSMFQTDAQIASDRADADPGVVVLSQWQGFAVLLAWAALFFVLSSILLRRRDA